MASDQEEIARTLATPGAKIILRYLRQMHRKAYLEYRKCPSWEETQRLQHKQYLIDTVLPKIIDDLMNSHVAKGRKREWDVWEWVKGKVRR